MTPERVIEEIDDRNIRAWREDNKLSAECNKKIHNLEKRVGALGEEEVFRQKNKLTDELNSRLEEIGNERYNRIRNSRVMVVGTGPLAQMISVGMSGLSVGHLYVVGNEPLTSQEKHDFLIVKDKNEGLPRSELIIERLLEIDKRPAATDTTPATYVGFDSRFNSALVSEFFQPSIIIEASNSKSSKNKVIRYCRDNKIPLISASSGSRFGALSCYWPSAKDIPIGDKISLDSIIQPEFNRIKQDIFTSGVVGGKVLEEFRKYLFKFSPSDKNLPSFAISHYGPYSKSRNNKAYELQPVKVNLKNKKVLVAGAGALGNFAAMALALAEVGYIDIIDDDQVEISNLNRQINFDLNHVGPEYKKASVLMERLKKLCPSLRGKGIVDRLTSDKDAIFKENSYDLVVGCFDNKEARTCLDNFAEKYNIPYLDGGTTPMQGNVRAYLKGRTKKITEQANFPTIPASCNLANPSVIISNMITGTMLAAEGAKILSEQDYKNLCGIIKYNRCEDPRINFYPYDKS